MSNDEHYFVGPMEPQEFLDEFLSPANPDYKNPTVDVMECFSSFQYLDKQFDSTHTLAQAFASPSFSPIWLR